MVERGVSVHTQRNYLNDLRQFSQFLQKEFPDRDLATIDNLTIRSYLGALYKKNKKSSIARKLASLRTFFKFLLRKNIIADDPTALVSTPRREKHMPSFLSVDEMFALLDNARWDNTGRTQGQGNNGNTLFQWIAGLRTCGNE